MVFVPFLVQAEKGTRCGAQGANSATAPATVGGERTRSDPLGATLGRIGRATTRKSGDLPSKRITNPGGVSWRRQHGSDGFRRWTIWFLPTPGMSEVDVSSLSNVPNTDQAKIWSSTEAIAVTRSRPCLTEVSALGLIAGALGLSAILWIAILAVL